MKKLLSNKKQVIQQVEKTTKLGMEGKITFPESLSQRLKLFSANRQHIDRLIEKLMNDEEFKLLTRLGDQLRLIIKLNEKQRLKPLEELKVRFADVMVWLVERGY